MLITGRNLNEVARRFTDHLNTVLNTTITQSRLTSRAGEYAKMIYRILAAFTMFARAEPLKY